MYPTVEGWWMERGNNFTWRCFRTERLWKYESCLERWMMGVNEHGDDRGEKSVRSLVSGLVDERCSMSLEWWIFFFFFFLIFSTRRNISTIVKYFVIIRIYGNLFWSRKMNHFLFDRSVMGSFRFVKTCCALFVQLLIFWFV